MLMCAYNTCWNQEYIRKNKNMLLWNSNVYSKYCGDHLFNLWPLLVAKSRDLYDKLGYAMSCNFVANMATNKKACGNAENRHFLFLFAEVSSFRDRLISVNEIDFADANQNFQSNLSQLTEFLAWNVPWIYPNSPRRPYYASPPAPQSSSS